MTKEKITNFCGTQHLMVDVGDYDTGRLVCLRQHGQSMSFQMDLTSLEARRLAIALLNYANIAEEEK